MKKIYYVSAIAAAMAVVLFFGLRDDHTLPEIRVPDQFFQLHPHEHLNFQLNRLLTCVGMDNLEEVRQVAGKINNLAVTSRAGAVRGRLIRPGLNLKLKTRCKFFCRTPDGKRHDGRMGHQPWHDGHGSGNPL